MIQRIESIVELTLITGKKCHFKRRSNSTTIYLLTLTLKKRSERCQRWCFKRSLVDQFLQRWPTLIPTSIIYESQINIITVIGKSSIKQSKIQTINFSPDSQLLIIEKEAYSFSPIEKLFIPPQIKEICEKTFGFCHELVTVEIPPNSELQKIQKNAFLLSILVL